jgi:integrase
MRAPMGSRPAKVPSMATLEHRGQSIRVNWRFGGHRDGARQSCTFKGPTPKARLKLAQAAQVLVESRGHNITRSECYAAILGKPTEPDSGVPLFRTWVEQWLLARDQIRDVQPGTVKRYRQIMATRIMPKLGNLRLTDIDPGVVQDWVAWLSSQYVHTGSKTRTPTDQRLSGATVNRIYSVLHTCLAAAVPRWIPLNPAARPAGSRKTSIGMPKIEPYDGIFLTPAEIDLILAQCNKHLHDLVLTALYTGMRLGELVALEARHVRVTGREVTVQVRQTIKDDGTVGTPKSPKSRRDLPVSDKPARVLARRVADLKPKDLVFPAPRGAMWDPDSLRSRYWWPAVARAQQCPDHPPEVKTGSLYNLKRKLRPEELSTCGCETRLHRYARIHDLRHSHASMLIAAKWSPKKVQLRMGHSTYRMTMDNYAHLWDLGEAGELEAVERVMDVVPTRGRGRGGSSARPVRRSAGRRRLVRR